LPSLNGIGWVMRFLSDNGATCFSSPDYKATSSTAPIFCIGRANSAWRICSSVFCPKSMQANEGRAHDLPGRSRAVPPLRRRQVAAGLAGGTTECPGLSRPARWMPTYSATANDVNEILLWLVLSQSAVRCSADLPLDHGFPPD